MKTVNEKRYKHGPEKRVENDSWKILWDVTITTVHIAEAVMVVIDKTKHDCKIIDFTWSFDSRIEGREKDKMKVYFIRIWKKNGRKYEIC